MRYSVFLLCFVCLFLLNFSSKAITVYLENGDSLNLRFVEKNSELKKSPPHALITFFREKIHLSKRVKSAILAFPFPFGMVGLHRIYLGAKPYVPVAYIATLGGVFGILPLIDFCTILFHKDFDHYQSNGQVFMWINE